VKRIPLIAALLTLAIHLVANPHYGFYRDELYFIVCGFHPDWGYVDQPPLVPLLSAGSQLFGTSLFLLRAVPALFAAGGVYVTCLLVIEIGGGEFAQILTALLTAFLPVLNAFGTKVSTDEAGLLLWPLAALCVAKMINGECRRLWLLCGAAIGVCGEAKYTVFFFGAAMLLALALTPERRILFTPWFVAGMLLGSTIALPSLLWQISHGWPFVVMIHHQQASELIVHSPASYMLQQVFITNPLLAPIWIAGVIYALREAQLRWIGLTYVFLLVAMIGLHARNYYPGDAYPLVLATGALAIERASALRAWRPAIVATVAAVSLLTLPFTYPGIAEAKLAAVIAAGQRVVKIDLKPTRDTYAPITENFADMHGWPELTAVVAGVYGSLPPQDRARAAILASNFAEAGAIDIFGKAHGLPPAISGHNNYWLWGNRGYDGSVVVEVNGTCGPDFSRARVAVTHFYNEWAMPTENGIPISVCYGLNEPLAQYWPKLQLYI
jgi:4-amino-4-deoxy-L-arabinose transferase-like glycosyltransferase